MAEWIQSGRLLDAILLLIVAEILTLAWWARRQRRQALFSHLLPTLLSGLVLMFTIRMALTDQSWVVIAGGLSAALVTHLWDLSGRLKS
ncbi:MAG: hypothetical protein V2I45_11945 [Halieaceae bacterium]|nr:hypothetical protein [Halieaceae bacterium]